MSAVLVVSAPWTVAPVQLGEPTSKGPDVVVGGAYWFRLRLLGGVGLRDCFATDKSNQPTCIRLNDWLATVAGTAPCTFGQLDHSDYYYYTLQEQKRLKHRIKETKAVWLVYLSA